MMIGEDRMCMLEDYKCTIALASSVLKESTVEEMRVSEDAST